MFGTAFGRALAGLALLAVASAAAASPRSSSGLGHDVVTVDVRIDGTPYNYSLRVNSAADFRCADAAVSFGLPDGAAPATPTVTSSSAGPLCTNAAPPVTPEVTFRQGTPGAVSVGVLYTPAKKGRKGAAAPLVIDFKGGPGERGEATAGHPECVNVGTLRETISCALPLATP